MIVTREDADSAQAPATGSSIVPSPCPSRFPHLFFSLSAWEKGHPWITATCELKMRPLTEPETQTVLKKLANYAGPSLKDLFAPLDSSAKPDHHVLRLSRSRVYYVRLSLANLATSVARDKLLSCGTCLGASAARPPPRSPNHP